jgi:hypothetical protein
LRTRCAILKQAGYNPEFTAVEQALLRLRTEHFDVVVVSALLKHEEKNQITSAAGSTPTFVMSGFTFPIELLTEVQTRLPHTLGLTG